MEPGVYTDNRELAEESSPRAPHHPPHHPETHWVAELWDILKTMVVAFVIMLLLNVYVFNLSMVKGQSMEPTLKEQERLFVDKLVYWFMDPRQGEVVILKDPSMDAARKSFLVKRVVAVPGDTVEVRNQLLIVNDQPLNEVYTDALIEDGDMEELKLGEGQYFVMGDNRHAGRSKDSRYFGSVSEELIIGRAEFVFWPVGRIRGL
ncbi:signal peptidase I [Paenibacillus senegalimassiliensis]|uniref:signal peptidase I n=1 Tax=Paenibacillus senegalimassiliensis TaxID=1737426 RepID=UPI00073E942E|nr:signal peptidase I [Paenibacillus senegalimassiliensis]